MKAFILCAAIGIGACWWTGSQIASAMSSLSATSATPAPAYNLNHRPPMPAHAARQAQHDVQVASAH